jgi:hypothetical protein
MEHYKMANPINYLYNYLDANTNEPVYPTIQVVDRIEDLLKYHLHTLQVVKVIKHGLIDKWGDEFIITNYYLDSETV